MLLFAENITPRLRYITGFIGEALTGQPISITTDFQAYEQATGPKINYSTRISSVNDLQVQPAGLLFEEGIQPQAIRCGNSNGYTVFFETGGDFPFDIFAASFYLLSRYEEYLPFTKDLYGRYPHTASLAFQQGFLDKPMVNYWLQDLKKVLQGMFPGLELREPAFRFLPTYDIDEAFAFRHKGWLRNTGGWLRDLFRGNLAQCRQRLLVLKGKQPDPYDAFDTMDELHQQYALSPLYFFLLASKRGQVDKNTDPSGEAMQQLVRRIAAVYQTGIHPSWQSGDEEALLISEKKQLQTLTGKPVTISRQHYLRFTLPEGYRRLLAAGILEDHSMGYGMVNGFRASVASPFYWYDLQQESSTALLLYPFCYMDANSFYELKHMPAQALEEMMMYYHEVKKVNGSLITLWHNTFLGTDPRFAGWKEVYTRFLQEIS
jgi:hypothetical protein